MNKNESKNTNSAKLENTSNRAAFSQAPSHIKKVKPMKTEAYKPKTTGLSCVPLGMYTP